MTYFDRPDCRSGEERIHDAGLTGCFESDNPILFMKTTLTDFQRNFHRAREAADRGDSVIVTGEQGEYVFERRAAVSEPPFAGLEGVIGVVTLPQDRTSLRGTVRRRLAEKDRRRRRRTA